MPNSLIFLPYRMFLETRHQLETTLGFYPLTKQQATAVFFNSFSE